MEENQEIAHALHVLEHYLPSQAPLKDFIHHNTLHAFQSLPFHKGLSAAQQVFGYQTYLSIDSYLELFEKGTISKQSLDWVLAQQTDIKYPQMFALKQEPNQSVLVGSYRLQWKNILGFDLDARVHPLLFRLVNSFLDQGIAVWQFPNPELGFLSALRKMEREGVGSIFNGDRARNCLLDESFELQDALDLIVGNEDAFENYLFDLEWQFVCMDTLIKSSRLFYLAMSIYLINKYREQLKESRSSIENIDLTWLKILVMGFAVVALVGVVLSFSKVIGLFYPVQVEFLIFLGLTTYYADLILVCFLLFYSAVNVTSVEKIVDQPKAADPEYQADPEYVERINNFMEVQKPYLKSNITLDTLSELMDVPARELSAILNGHFKMNFYEFVNNFRIEEAKRIMQADTDKQKTVSDIFLEVGFNSKSVFNTFFKKNVGMTPTEYRKQPIA